MSGLFDTLAARFAPDARPAIRPLPQARFEGDAGGDGIEEQHGERIAVPPRSIPTTPRAPAPRRATPPPDTPKQPAKINEAVPETPSDPSSSTAEPPASATEPRADQRAEKPLEDAQPTPRSASVAQDTLRPRRAESPQPPKPAGPTDPPESRETITERIIETVRHEPDASLPPEPSQAALPMREDGGDEPPGPTPEPAVIRIGRIEVTRPAPPSPPPPQPVAPRPEPPRRAAPAPRVKQPSGLTDYLGWKKR